MTDIAIRDRSRSALNAFVPGLAAVSLLVWSGLAQAAPPPQSFSGLAKTVTPAVVNIASSQEITGPDVTGPNIPFDFPEGSPFERYFKQFRNGRGAPQPHRATALGSGFIVDTAGYIVTNNHVVDGASDVEVRLDDDSVYPATIVGTDAKSDMALLKIDAKRALPAVQFGDSDKTEVGDWVMAVGNPFGLGGSVTAGIISARGRNIDAGPYDDFLQIDAPINQGNSGGPLFNMEGQVIGVNTAIYSPNGGSVGIGFAIPSNMAETVVAQLKQTGKVERGWLGVQIQKVTPEIAGAVGLKDAQGAMVTAITPDSPAAKAGVKQGDIILSFAEQKIGDPRELARVVAKERAGSKTTLAVWRDRGEKSLTIFTGLQPDQGQLAAVQSEAGSYGSYHSSDLNADLAALTPERRAEFGIADEVNGVLVVDVKEGSVFEQGLRPGDVIEQVDRVPVASPQEVEAMVHKATSRPNKSVLILVKRQTQDLFLGLTLGVA